MYLSAHHKSDIPIPFFLSPHHRRATFPFIIDNHPFLFIVALTLVCAFNGHNTLDPSRHLLGFDSTAFQQSTQLPTEMHTILWL